MLFVGVRYEMRCLLHYIAEIFRLSRISVVERPIDFTFLGGLLALLPDNGAIHLLISRFLSNLMQIHSPGQTVHWLVTDVLPVLLMVV